MFTAKLTSKELSFARKTCQELTVVRDSLIDEPVARSFSLSHLKHHVVYLQIEANKIHTLIDLYDQLHPQAFVFAATRRKIDWIQAQLQERDYTISAMHGDIDQGTRDIILKEFRTGASRILLTGGGLMQGIDIFSVTSVLLYDLPRSAEDYLSFASRCGRFGRNGKVISLVTNEDLELLKVLEVELGIQFEELQPKA